MLLILLLACVCSGAYYKYMYMRVLCLESSADDATKELLWLLSLWISCLPCGTVRFYIPEHKQSFAYCIDTDIKHVVAEDYII